MKKIAFSQRHKNVYRFIQLDGTLDIYWSHWFNKNLKIQTKISLKQVYVAQNVIQINKSCKIKTPVHTELTNIL